MIVQEEKPPDFHRMEQSWKAVIDNFKDPKDRRIRLRAKASLAALYVRRERYDEAAKIYRGFTIEDDNDESLKAAGYAGLAVVASRKGDYGKSQRIITDQLNPLRQKGRLTRWRELEAWVREAEQRNQGKGAPSKSKTPPGDDGR